MRSFAIIQSDLKNTHTYNEEKHSMFIETFLVSVYMCFRVFRLAVSTVTHHKVINRAVTWQRSTVISL